MTCNDSAIQLGTVGVAIERTIREKNQDGVWEVKDVSVATGVTLRVKDPMGDVHDFVGDFTTDGTDGKVVYVTASASDLDVAGRWTAQFILTYPAGPHRTSKFHFDVETPL